MEITKLLLDETYNREFDVETFKSVDPCGIVYELMSHTDDQLDIELGALFVAMIAWGNRKAIRRAARHMLEEEMLWHPGRFVLSEAYEDCYVNAKNNCVYRTLNVDNFKKVCRNVRAFLLNNQSVVPLTLESLLEGKNCREAIEVLCRLLAPAKLGTPEKSACKRICLYLRWMTRTEAPDFGIWQHRSQADLYAVMDVHVCTLASQLLVHKNASWQSCVELTNIFKSWDESDPLKYDVALMTLADVISSKPINLVL